jgi:hypothetical protein
MRTVTQHHAPPGANRHAPLGAESGASPVTSHGAIPGAKSDASPVTSDGAVPGAKRDPLHGAGPRSGRP